MSVDLAVEGIQGDLKNLQDQIAALQNSAGQITPADQALLDGIEAKAAAIHDKLDALDAMTPQHRRNLLRWLERHADKLKDSAEWSWVMGPQPSGDMASADFEAAFDEMLRQGPREWLHETPFVKRLVRMIESDKGGTEPLP